MYEIRLLTLFALTFVAVPPAQAAECVVFLHGLARTSASMDKAAAVFEKSGFAVSNVQYPSTKYPIEELAPLAVEAGLAECPADSVKHFVTHSLGAILIRYYLEQTEISNLGRVIMLAPPNKGSQVIDSLRHFPGFKAIHGPAVLQLGTDEESVPLMLGAVDYEVGVIAGTRTFNPILSQYLPNPDDGKVSVENTKVEGMTDFVMLPVSHPFIMKSPIAIAHAYAFIRTGRFAHDTL